MKRDSYLASGYLKGRLKLHFIVSNLGPKCSLAVGIALCGCFISPQSLHWIQFVNQEDSKQNVSVVVTRDLQPALHSLG